MQQKSQVFGLTIELFSAHIDQDIYTGSVLCIHMYCRESGGSLFVQTLFLVR
jgi:hypothetical protein